MLQLVMQLQMLLAAFSAFLPLVPAGERARASEIVDLAARALAASGGVAGNMDDLARELAAIRAEVEAMAASGKHFGPEELDSAMARVRAASAAFRAAVEIAEARPS